MITNLHIEKRIFEKEDREKLKKTNELFNNLKFNSCFKIGRLSTIINKKSFENDEEWINYYFETGYSRKDNYNYGRTKEEFEDIIKEYFEAISSNLPTENFTYQDARKQMFQRVFYDTWDGMKREFNTISILKRKFPKYDFIKTNGNIDIEYAIDVEVVKQNKLIAGIQLKPLSYKKDKKLEYIKNSVKINQDKNIKYIKKYNIPVFYLFYDKNKDIVETNDYILLKHLISNFLNLCQKSLSTYVKNKDKEYILVKNSYLYQFKYNIMFEVKKEDIVKFAFVIKDSYSIENLTKYQLIYNVPVFEIEYINNQIILKKLQIIIK